MKHVQSAKECDNTPQKALAACDVGMHKRMLQGNMVGLYHLPA